MKKLKKFLRREIGVSLRVYLRPKKEIIYQGYICWGLYTVSKKSHIIEYHAGLDNIALACVLAHEYVHAWQRENGYDQLRHKRDKFPAWVKYFKSKYKLDIIKMCQVE
jgi:hypothetical protein